VTTVAVLQPGYLPWLGYFEQMYRADTFVLYDDVQYTTRDWRSRNRIRTAQGPQWLTVPVVHEQLRSARISDVQVDNRIPWRERHWRAVELSYRRAPFFSRYADRFEALYRSDWTYLVDVDIAFSEAIADELGLHCRVVRSSSLAVAGTKTARLAHICQVLGATRYYSGAAARDYLDVAAMERLRISVEFQEYQHPTYRQVYAPFIPYMSALDLLLNCGPTSLSVLVRGGSTRDVDRPDGVVTSALSS
jgi:hypothetical protein